MQPQQIPQPAGTDENGNPFWVIDGRQYSWADMQQYLWQMQQQQPQAQPQGVTGGVPVMAPGAGNSFESLPQMPVVPVSPEVAPNIPSSPETGPEFSPERAMERSVESTPEQAGEQQVEQPQVPEQPVPQQKPQAPAASLIGDSQDLSSVDPASPTSMASYAEQHKNDPDNTSGKFLSVFFDKLLKILSLGR